MRARALDEMAEAHAAVGGTARGRRYTTQQLNQAYAVLLAAHFQGFWVMGHFGVRRFDAAFFLSFFFLLHIELPKKKGKKAASNRRTPKVSSKLTHYRFLSRLAFGVRGSLSIGDQRTTFAFIVFAIGADARPPDRSRQRAIREPRR